LTRPLYFAYPGDLDAKTGGYGYDRRVISELRSSGWKVILLPVGDGFPFPATPTLKEAEAALSALPDGSLVVVDGLAYGVLANIAQKLAQKLRFIALVHHPLALEGNLPEDVSADLAASERRALSYAEAIIVTSSTTRNQLVQSYEVSADKIVVALPGTDAGVRAYGNPAMPQILSIGSIIPRKGHDVLVAALAQITDLPWQCRIIGSRTMDAECHTKLELQIRDNGLAERIKLVGPVDDTRAELAKSDIFALASRYEGYGMVFAEALSHGLPIVACRAGAVPEVVPEDAGMLVDPDNPTAFAKALQLFLKDTKLRMSMADASFDRGATLPNWNQTALQISAALEKVINERV
jgi:glycosyltransferase involved in cell wall biosynthesis